jgi:hypothetical protein
MYNKNNNKITRNSPTTIINDMNEENLILRILSSITKKKEEIITHLLNAFRIHHCHLLE